MNDLASITVLKKVPSFKTAADKLLIGVQLTKEESSLLLSSAVLLLRYGSIGQNRPRSLELAYWIVLNYSLNTEDFKPLFDFAFDLGLYPLAKAISSISDNAVETLNDCIALAKVEENFTDDVTLTLEQKLADEAFSTSVGKGFAYIAPTSFGKTERLVRAVLDERSGARPCIIVPTKSLLAQTREDLFECHPHAKVITHDEMYQGENRFIAILTQERAIRLLEAHPSLSFSRLFIDEAHNAFRGDDRALLISRLIRESNLRNPCMKVYFFSPVINDIDNLSAISGFKVAGYKVLKSMKEPRYYYLDNDGVLSAYNRFFDTFCEQSHFTGLWDCVTRMATNKNLVYLSSPRKIRGAALDLAKYLPIVDETPDLLKVKSALEAHISPMYDELTCLQHGVIYLHGQMPDGIKNYLLDCATKLRTVRFIFANSVIMEGMNLPFESVFILNLQTSRLTSLVNLIGRASRLNYVFGAEPHLDKLRPQIVFAESQWAGQRPKLENAISELHKVGFEDCRDNLRIKESAGESLSLKDRQRLTFEDELINTSQVIDDSLSTILNRSGLQPIYENWITAKSVIVSRFRSLKVESDDDIFELICKYFIDDSRFEFTRKYGRIGYLRSQIDFYRNYVKKKTSLSLSQRLASDIGYWKRKSSRENCLLYVGSSFGDCDVNGRAVGNGRYVDISIKENIELPALFLAKYKTEDDYLGFTLSRFVRILYRTNLIDQDRFQTFIYGTSDQRSVNLIQAGVPLSLIKILKENDMYDDIYLDDYGNVKIGRKLQAFSKRADDYIGFEIGQFNID